MARCGKIARLPGTIRDELNRRLDNGEQGTRVLAWLNGLPPVTTRQDDGVYKSYDSYDSSTRGNRSLQFDAAKVSSVKITAAQMKRRPASISFKYLAAVVLILMPLLLWQAYAQYFRGGWGGRGRRLDIRNAEEERENEQMEKAINPAFKEDVFTFARLRFDAERGYGFGGGRLWDDDSPEADLNVIFRLYETTSLKVRPGLNFIDITTNDLANYPFVYVAAGGRFMVSDADADCLRHFMLNGGFVMVDDFWGDEQWHHFYEQLKQIFPNREPVELTLDHPIFHTVFKFKKLPQIPSVGTFMSYGLPYDPGWPYDEKNHDPHYYAVYDDKNRMMMLICHNNHFGDGWEHEGDDHTYFDTFSEPMGYPMLINIITYAMSH